MKCVYSFYMYLKYVCVCVWVVEMIPLNKYIETHQIPISQCLCLRMFSLNFVPLNLCIFFSYVTRFDSYFIAIFDVKMLMRNDKKVLIKPKIFRLCACKRGRTKM